MLNEQTSIFVSPELEYLILIGPTTWRERLSQVST